MSKISLFLKGFRPYEEKCFLNILELYTWEEAEMNCRDKYSANLVAIIDRYEQSSLTLEMTGSGDKWIGLKDDNGTYKWTSNDSFSFVHWDRYQPG